MLASGASDQANSTNTVVVRDFSPGKLVDTKNSADLALTHTGFFVVEGPTGEIYTRQGSLRRDADGRLVTAKGWPVQAVGGGDIILKGETFEISADGVVTQAGAPVAQLAVVDFAGPKTFTDVADGYIAADPSLMAPVASPGIRQGVLEASNVSTADDMVSMMAALRQAEAAQRLVNIYDDLMGRVISTFGQA